MLFGLLSRVALDELMEGVGFSEGGKMKCFSVAGVFQMDYYWHVGCGHLWWCI